VALVAGVLTLGDVTLPGADELARENSLLRERLASLEADLTTLEARVHEASLLEERMRLLADLDPIDAEVRMMGVGGPDFSARDPLHDLNVELAATVGDVRGTTDALLRQSELQRHSFIEILESLEQRQEHWSHVPSIRPVAEGRITSGFGRRVDPFTKRRAFHRGIDISARRGVPIVATADGRVVFAKKNGNFGLTVKIDHGNGVQTLYAHALDLKVKKGQRVKRGDVIARVGSSGKSTAPHLHYEVQVDKRAMNPRRFILDGVPIID
jgi:murein DD-endopeptidase MepM/ murein hydrolase activator NlpD